MPILPFWLIWHEQRCTVIKSECNCEQKYCAPQIRPDKGSNSWPADHDSTFHVTKMVMMTFLGDSSALKYQSSQLVIILPACTYHTVLRGTRHFCKECCIHWTIFVTATYVPDLQICVGCVWARVTLIVGLSWKTVKDCGEGKLSLRH